jgi:hypothetical protein
MTKELLDLYSDYLLSSFGATTATGLSKLLDGAVSHDQVTRFLSEKVKTSSDLWRVVKPLVRQIESEEGVLIFDDSIEEKPYTDENDIICWHYDHTQGRNVKGINFLSALYHSQGVSLPIAFHLVAKTEEYLVAIIDWFSRYVLTWQLSNTLDGYFCLDALQQALNRGKPLIFNTDQGAQFTSDEFIACLERATVRISGVLSNMRTSTSRTMPPFPN